jgi:cobalt-zinc-cadmium efflux system membrane fusion protein
MNQKSFLFQVSIFVFSFLIQACSSDKKPLEKEVSFRLSDTMLQKCPVEKVSKSPVLSEMRLFGKIEPDNNKMAQVYSVLGGNVVSIHVELGDHVQKGEVLAVIKSTEVAEFQKELMNAKSDVALAEKNLQVARELNSSKLNSERDVRMAEREVENSRSELERIKEVYSIYKLDKGSTFKIVAPMSGFVVQKNINQNELIRPDQTGVLFSIAEINEVWVMAYVNESDISNIKLGYEAEVSTLSFPDEKYFGKIDKIFNTIDPETKAMKVRVRIPNASFKLKPDMNATIVVKNTEKQEMIAIPSSAVIFDKSKNWVMVFKSRAQLETRKIEIYRTVGDVSFIAHGLKAGEKIIVKNGIFVYDALND